MALQVENGSGVVGANSYVTVEEATAYSTARGAPEFGAAQPADQEAALIKAADYLRNEKRYPYRGTRATVDQGLSWPRVGVVMLRGPAVPDNTIPQLLKDAQCELALRAVTGVALQPDLERGGRIQTEKVDVLSTTYFDDAPSDTTFQVVQGLLEPLLRCGTDYPMPFQVEPPDDPPYADEGYEYK